MRERFSGHELASPVFGTRAYARYQNTFYAKRTQFRVTNWHNLLHGRLLPGEKLEEADAGQKFRDLFASHVLKRCENTFDTERTPSRVLIYAHVDALNPNPKPSSVLRTNLNPNPKPEP